jgi:hypothetical protein
MLNGDEMRKAAMEILTKKLGPGNNNKNTVEK